MGKVTTNISFDKEFLNKLKNDRNACVHVRTETFHFGLHPFHLTDLKSSIRSLLNNMIAKYDMKLGGILLGYQNIRLLDNVGAINFDSCFIHTNIEAEFYVFNPDVGQVLNGVVNKKSTDHIGCLVHKTFNVSLPKPDDCEDWIGHLVQLGQEIQFEITFTNFDGKLPYIRGKILSILSEDSGFSTGEEPIAANNAHSIITKFNDTDEEVNEAPTKKRKRKHEENIIDGEHDIVTEQERKKHKKTKGTLNSEANICDTEVERKHKKKKHEAPTKEQKHKHEENIIDGEHDIVTEPKRKKQKKTKDTLTSETNICDTEVERKHKKEKHEVPMKEQKHKHEENIIDGEHDMVTEPKRKKHKKTNDTLTSETNICDTEVERKQKKKKHKHKEIEKSDESSVSHIDNDIEIIKAKKSKKKKKHKDEDRS